MDKSKFISFLENHAGTIQRAWNQYPGEEKWPFQVIEMRGGVLEGISVFATLGLSEFSLRSKSQEKSIRHELILSIPTALGELNVPSLLHSLGKEAIDKGRAYFRGEVIGPRPGVLLPNTGFKALFVAPPVCFPDSFSSFNSPDGSTIIIAWLIPIYLVEALFVSANGWNQFESILAKNEVDLFDFKRLSAVQ